MGNAVANCRVLIWYWGRRGAGPVYAREVARALTAVPGMEVHLSLSRQSDFFDETMALDLPGFHVDTYTDLASFLLGFLRAPFLARGLARYIRRERIDAVLCPMEHLWNVVTVPPVKRACGSYILVVHDAQLHEGEGNRVREMFRRIDIARADEVVTLTDHVREGVRFRYRVPPDRLSVAPMGALDYRERADRPRTWDGVRAPVVAMFGRILPYKGISVFAEAVRLLRQQGKSMRFAIIGEGAMSESERRAVDEAGIDLQQGWVPDEQVPEILSSIDLVVLPYKAASQSGVVPMTFAQGIPAVVTPVGGLVEQVHDRTNAIVARDVSGSAVAHAIADVFRSPDFYEALSRGALSAQTASWTQAASVMAGIVRKASPRQRLKDTP